MKQALTVLVVEDNPGDARLVRESFRPFGECRLEHVGSLAAALRRLEQGNVDAVLLDLGLPDAEGTEALERLRERYPDVATLVLTGRDDSEVAVEAVASGAQDYLVKGSFDSAGLRRAVNYAVERRRSANKLEHLNRVLQSIRSVNQLIVRERDPQRLMERACHLLVDTRGYSGVWIVGGDRGVRATANAGWGASFEPFEARLRRGEWPGCRSRIGTDEDVVEIEPTTCSDCPLSAAYSGDQAVVALLQRGDVTHGLMGVRLPNHLRADEAELDLLREVAGDIAFALHDIHAEGAQQHAHQQ